jgi:signal transduction histidine kinase
VLDHLIGNALKFTAAGHVDAAIHDYPERREIAFHVTDTGPGIAANDLPTIFEAFRQVDASLTREHGGAGLGLALVKKYVVLLGGRIEVESEVGVGTRFVVTLPYRAAQPIDPSSDLSAIEESEEDDARAA